MSGARELFADNFARVVSAGEDIPVVNPEWLKLASFTRDGADLHIEGPNGHLMIVQGYFTAEPQPSLYSPDGQVFPPSLIGGFVLPGRPGQYAGPSQGASPVGVIEEASGEVTVTRTDGTVETVGRGAPVFQGDIVETGSEGAANIVFIDESSFAISDDARLAIDEYVFDPDTGGGSTGVSMLRGLFVFTSGLIAREDPDDVTIGTPTGSIGIRGTVIAGNVTTGEFTVIEGAIVVRSHSGQEVTLADAFQTVSFNSQTGQPEFVGTVSPAELGGKFAALGKVVPAFFASIAQGSGGTSRDGGDASGASGEGAGEEAPVDEAGSEPEAESESGDGAEAAESGDESGGEPEAETEGTAETSTEADADTTTSEPVSETTRTTTSSTTDSTTTSTATSQSASNATNTGTISVSESLATNFYGDAGDTSLIADTSTGTSLGSEGTTDPVSDSGAASGGDTSGSTSASDPSTVTDPPPPPPPPPPANTPPTISDVAFSMNENSAVGAIVGSVSASDPDTGQTLSYSISAGNNGAFAINASGQITVAGSVDFETLSAYSLTVTVSDSAGGSDSATVSIAVNDVNDAPVVSAVTMGVLEDAVAATVVGMVVGADQDTGQTLTWAISAGNTGGVFAIDSGSGEITVVSAGVMDRETTTVYSLTVTATDDGTGSLQGSNTITINIGDANDVAPTLDAAGPFSIAEDMAPGTTVDSPLSFSDPDTSGTHLFSIVGGSGVAKFLIDPVTGQISLDGALDYETTTFYTLEVEVSDGVATGSRVYTIDVTNVDDAAPVLDLDGNDSTWAGTGYGGTFTEAGGLVAIVDTDLTLVDPDSGNLQLATITLSNMPDTSHETLGVNVGATGLVANYDSGTGILTLTGSASVADYQGVLKTLRYDNASQAPDPADRIIEITVSDGINTSAVATSTISVVPINDPPVANDDQFASNDYAGTVGNVFDDNGFGVDSDPDLDGFGVTEVNGSPGDVGAWVAGSEGGRFQIGTNGEFTFDPQADFDHLGTGESATTSVTYTIWDGNGGTDTATVTVTVNGASMQLGTANEILATSLTGTAGLGIGDYISAAGDIDGDGYFDLLFTNATGDSVQKLFGKPGEFVSSDDSTFNTNNGGTYLSSVAAGFSGTAEDVTVSWIGDFDGDGTGDYAVGAYAADSGSAAGSGQLFIIDNAGSKILELNGMSAGDWLGESVAGVGDVNGDGFDDVLVGAPESLGGDGSAYLLFGHPVAPAPVTQAISELGTGLRGTAGSGGAYKITDGMVVGNHLYAIETQPGVNGRIATYDISDPRNPVWTGNTATDVDMEGGNAIWYDAATQKALATSAPTGQVNLVHFNTPASSFTQDGWAISNAVDCLILGNTGYVLTSDEQIYIIEDISGTPTLNGTPIDLSASLTTAAEKIETDGTHLFVMSQTELVKVTTAGVVGPDLSLPAGNVDLAIDQDAHIAYVANPSTGRIELIDLSSLTIAGTLDHGTHPELNDVKAVYVKQDGADHFLYVVSSDGTTSGTVSVFQITANLMPLPIGRHEAAADGFIETGFDIVVTSGTGGIPLLLSQENGGSFRVVDPLVDGIRIDGPGASGARLGDTVSRAGDFNADGFADFAVMLPGSGESYVYLGQSRGNLANLGVDKITVSGLQGGALDQALHYSGDIDGDGVSDLAFYDQLANAGKGEVFVVFGNNAYVSGNSVDVGALDGTSGFRIATGAGTKSIMSAGAAGDFNGDGADDFVVVLKEPGAGNRTAEIFVLFGGDGAAWSDGTVDYAELTDSATAYSIIYQIPASVADADTYDFNIVAADDINGDGFADIAIGMPNEENLGTDDGSLHVVYGRDTQGAALVEDGVIAGPAEGGWWKFDETTGTVASDSSGNVNDGALNGGPGRVTGFAGGALQFDGTDDYVDIAAGPNIAGNSFTISAWIKLDSSGMEQTILSHGSAGPGTALLFGIDDTGHLFASFGGARLTGPGVFGTGTWYNVALSYDSAANERTLYVNGTQTASDDPGGDFTGTGLLQIGRNALGAPNFFDGTIDDLRIFDQILSDDLLDAIATAETDADSAAESIAASANFQSLIGSETGNVMDDNGMIGTSFRGGGGNDTILISNMEFGDIDGGSNNAGRDVIEFFSGGTIDFSLIGSEQVSHIEEIRAGMSGQTVRLSLADLFRLPQISDDGTFHIGAFDPTTVLEIDDPDVVAPMNGLGQTAFAEHIGAVHDGSDGFGYDVFKIGGSELRIDTTLFTSNQVDIV
ncbi:MAG: hypothetical protein EOM26_10525 [Alphaproteobacteria bacterium]|nr:hypothetical protein [Alphaproteobacteria bacterium]